MTDVAAHQARRAAAVGVAAALVTLSVWTAWIVATRAAVSGQAYFSPAMLILIRFGVSVVFLAPVLLKMGLFPKGLNWPRRFGLLMSGSPYVFLVGMGMKYAPVADVGPLLPGTMPLIVAILSAVIFGERFSMMRRLGMVMVAVGIVMIVTGTHRGDSSNLFLGHVLILLGALSWAIYTISLRGSGLSGIQATAYVAVWSLVVAIPFILPSLPVDFARAAQAPLRDWLLQIFVQGVLSGFVALLTYTIAVRNLGPTRSAALTGLTPVTVMLAGWAFLAEVPAAIQVVACVVIVVGVLLSTGVISPDRWRSSR